MPNDGVFLVGYGHAGRIAVASPFATWATSVERRRRHDALRLIERISGAAELAQWSSLETAFQLASPLKRRAPEESAAPLEVGWG